MADEPVNDAVAEAIRDRFGQALRRDRPDPQKKPPHELEEERERQRELDRDLGWEF